MQKNGDSEIWLYLVHTFYSRGLQADLMQHIPIQNQAYNFTTIEIKYNNFCELTIFKTLYMGIQY